MASAEAPQPLKVGMILPLTGPFADWGNSIRIGAELAGQDAKNSLSIFFEDDECSSVKAISAAEKLLTLDKAQVLIGPCDPGGLPPLAASAEQRSALVMSVSFLDDAVFQNRSNLINLATQISVEAEAIVKALSEHKVTTLAVVHGSNKFGEEFSRQLERLCPQYNVRLVADEAADLSSTDFRSLILRLRANKPLAIFIHEGESQTGQFLRQLRELGGKEPVYSYYGFQSDTVLKSAGPAAEGVHYTYPVPGDGEEKEKFDERYRSLSGGINPTATSYFVYDGMMLLSQAGGSCRELSSECIRRYFTGRTFPGISGEMSFLPDGRLVRRFGLKTVRNGAFVWETR